MPEKEERPLAVQLDLNLADCQVLGGSIGCGPHGSTFAFTVEPVSIETLAALDRAIDGHGTLRVLFPQPLLLELVSLERKGPRGVRIVGRIIDPLKAHKKEIEWT